MSLIMLAIGGLLALLGVYAMASGFPVIEVERGWAMVISGAVLLSGGLVVAALGIVVRTINGLKGGFLTVAAPSHHDVPSLAPSVVATPAQQAAEPVPAFAVAAPAVAAVLATSAGYGAGHEAAPHEAAEPHHEPEVREPAVEPVDHVPEDHSPEPVAAEPAPHEMFERKPFGQGWHEQDFSAFDLDAPHEPVAVHTPEPPSAPEPHPLEPREVPSALDHAEPAHEPTPVHVSEPAPEPVVDHAAEPVADAPSTALETPPNSLSVIGRYDSDGTSYVMYSDGSIEAQSETGVFRFNSMAELKAFIEG